MLGNSNGVHKVEFRLASVHLGTQATSVEARRISMTNRQPESVSNTANVLETLDVTIILPCYNELPFLKPTVAQIQAIMDITKYSYEIILYDDGSRDDSRELIAEIASQNGNVRWGAHQENLGRGRTVTDAMKMARGRVVGFLDVDLEISASFIVPAILMVEQGSDVVAGARLEYVNLGRGSVLQRFLGFPYWMLRRVASACYSWLVQYFTGLEIDTEAGLKFFNRERIMPVVDRTQDDRWFWDTEIMALSQYAGLRIRELPCLVVKNPAKKSSVRVVQDSLYYLRQLIAFKRRIDRERSLAHSNWTKGLEERS